MDIQSSIKSYHGAPMRRMNADVQGLQGTLIGATTIESSNQLFYVFDEKNSIALSRISPLKIYFKKYYKSWRDLVNSYYSTIMSWRKFKDQISRSLLLI